MDYYTEQVVELIREVGVARLIGYDGCYCGDFAVRGVEVDVACGKGRPRGIWIYSCSDDFSDKETLGPIAEEVARQIMGGDCRGPMPIHYRKWSKDLDR